MWVREAVISCGVLFCLPKTCVLGLDPKVTALPKMSHLTIISVTSI